MHKKISQELLDEPVSTTNPVFVQAVKNMLHNCDNLVILIRYSNSAGSKDYFIVKTPEAFRDILGNLHSKTSISVFSDKSLPIKGIVNSDLQQDVLNYLNDLPDDEKEVFILQFNAHSVEEDFNLHIFETKAEITSWFEKNKGVLFWAGGLPFWESNSEMVITAYLPDDDGVVRPGAY